MPITTEVLAVCIGWAFALFWAITHFSKARHGSVGLPVAYLLSMTIMHCGVAIYLAPTYVHESDPYLYSQDFTKEMVLDGACVSLVGIFALMAGALLAERFTRPKKIGHQPATQLQPLLKALFRWLFILSVVCFVLAAALPPLPSTLTLLTAGQNAGTVAICAALFLAIKLRRKRQLLFNLIIAALIPATYLMIFGFLSFGIIAGAVIGSFMMAQYPIGVGTIARRSPIVVLTLYLGLTAFVGYMDAREKIREVVWGGGGMVDRLSVVMDAVTAITPFNPLDDRTLDLLNARLNQNRIIGKAMAVLDNDPSLYENGNTIIGSVSALVPRVFWPGKPVTGGNAFVGGFTDTEFTEATSVGAGLVFELYVNYGYFCVIVGFMAFGAILRWLDIRAAENLRAGRLKEYSKIHLVGITLINPLSLISTMVASAIGAWIFGILLVRFVNIGRTPQGTSSLSNAGNPGPDASPSRPLKLPRR